MKVERKPTWSHLNHCSRALEPGKTLADIQWSLRPATELPGEESEEAVDEAQKAGASSGLRKNMTPDDKTKTHNLLLCEDREVDTPRHEGNMWMEDNRSKQTISKE